MNSSQVALDVASDLSDKGPSSPSLLENHEEGLLFVKQSHMLVLFLLVTVLIILTMLF